MKEEESAQHGNNGQYGVVKNESDPYLQMPDEVLYGTIDVSQVRQLICGYQCTALVMNDGTMYCWGNLNSQLNLKEMSKKFTEGIQKVAFSNYNALMLKEDGTVSIPEVLRPYMGGTELLVPKK